MVRASARSVAAVVLAAAALASACSPAPSSHGAPPTTGAPFPAAQVDTLPVAASDMPLVGDTIRSDVAPDVEQSPQATQTQGPCGLVDAPNDSAQVFGDPLGFRWTRNSGWSNVYVSQGVGVYPDAATAQSVFANLVTSARECGEQTFTTVDPSQLAWQRAAGRPGDAGPTTTADQARLVQNVVVWVTVTQYEKSPQIAAGIADQIAAKITNPA